MTTSYSVPVYVPVLYPLRIVHYMHFYQEMGMAEAGTEGTSFWSRFRGHPVLFAEEIDEWLPRSLTGACLIQRKL